MRPMTTITNIRTVSVPVRSQASACEFFVDTLGFECRLDVPMGPNQRWIEVAPVGATGSLALVAADGSTSTGMDTGIRFTVPDAAVEHEALRAKGVRVDDLQRWEGVPPMFAFDDPDGNRFYVVEGQR